MLLDSELLSVCNFDYSVSSFTGSLIVSSFISVMDYISSISDLSDGEFKLVRSLEVDLLAFLLDEKDDFLTEAELFFLYFLN